jgi:hypothetical protein
MRRVNLAHAKSHLSDLVKRAAAGDPVCITRRESLPNPLAGVLDRTEDGGIVFPYDEVHVDFVLRVA